KTKTAMGKRLIRNWTECPLYDCAAIIRRQNAVDELYGNTPLREELMSLMGGIYDMERLMTRVLYNTANAKELLSLKSTLSPLPRIKEMLSGCTSSMLKSVYDNIDLLEDVYNLVNDAISEDAPFSVREGGMFGDADPVGHVLDGNAVESAFADELHRRIQHFRTTLLWRFAGTFRSLFLCHDSE
ncbi:protein containing DNA mismatch repair protein MutS, core domain protein, partial [human gut metagenome]